MAARADTAVQTHEHTYKSGDTWKLNLTVIRSSASSKTLPAIVFFFGGGWRAGSTRQFEPHAVHYAGRGLAAILVDYRVQSRHQTTPHDSVADARDALHWIHEHASDIGVDPKRIVVSGGSAGGHLAACLGTLPSIPAAERPFAMVLFNPVVDVISLGVARERFGDRAQEASPIAYVKPGLPPALILHGIDDKTVPIEQVRRFCQAMTGAGNQCQVVEYEGAGHGFFNKGRENDRWYTPTLAEADRFLESLSILKTHGKTPSLQ
jgi:acetyl esterase/lipase